jgi:Pyridoxamine 5'-phosphate oxidase
MVTSERNTDVEDLLRSTLAAHSSLFLATCGDSGPWVNGVYFAETGLFTLSLALEQRGRTLASIRQASRVAVIVSTGSPGDPFLQAQATAELVTGDAAEEVRRVLLEKVPAAEPFFATPIETVTLRVDQWRVTDMQKGWFPGRELSAP